MRILAFAASNNPQSINQQLALSVAQLLPQAQVTTLNIDDYELPLYSERREAELGSPPQVQAFLQEIAAADGLIVSFAEHNGTFTAAFKNLYDWASRSQRHIFQHKPALFLAAAPGPGGAQTRMLETTVDDRIANMAAFTRNALALLEDSLGR